MVAMSCAWPCHEFLAPEAGNQSDEAVNGQPGHSALNFLLIDHLSPSLLKLMVLHLDTQCVGIDRSLNLIDLGKKGF